MRNVLWLTVIHSTLVGGVYILLAGQLPIAVNSWRLMVWALCNALAVGLAQHSRKEA